MIELAVEPHLRCLRCGTSNTYDEPQWCQGCGAKLVGVHDDVPSMGEQYERELSTCMCGEPWTPGVVHRTDGPCYHLENING
jgi:hypothetical protein